VGIKQKKKGTENPKNQRNLLGKLTFLNCYENHLTSFDISDNYALEELYCGLNQLINMDLTNNTALKELYCNDNQLTSLDVTHNANLEVLFCYSNNLTSLNVSQNSVLTQLFCGRNKLTNLNLSENTLLGTVYHNGYWYILDISYMPELQMVCVNENVISHLSDICRYASPNAYFTTNCN